MPVSAALVIAHPGHELRAFGFLRRYHPKVAILTDGSGSQGEPRIARTQQILRENDCREGCWMGEISDTAIYGIILAGEVTPFVEWTIRLAAMLRENFVTLVAGDALEGFSPSHDLCRFMLDAATDLLARETGRRIVNHGFFLDGPPGVVPFARKDDAVVMNLDDAEFAAKKAAAHGYEELRNELQRALDRFGEAPFRREVYFPAPCRLPLEAMFRQPPDYEVLGEQRVREGVFPDVIRFHRHVRPLVERLRASLGLKQA